MSPQEGWCRKGGEPPPACRPPSRLPPQVFRVRHRASGEVFAIKRSVRRFRSKLQRERCLREIRAVAALPPHPNIVVSGRAGGREGGGGGGGAALAVQFSRVLPTCY